MAESRLVAGLLLDEVSLEQWQQAIKVENILQCSTAASAERVARLLRQRLQPLPADMLQLITTGTAAIATHACLAAAVKRHRLLADFLTTVLRPQYNLFAKELNPSLWEDFLAECASRDPTVLKWSDSTRRKLRNVIFQILEQAGYVDSAKSLRLQRVHIARPVLASLMRSGDQSVYNCIDITS